LAKVSPLGWRCLTHPATSLHTSMSCESVQRCGCELVLRLPGQQRVWWVGVHLHMRRWLRTVWHWCQSFVHGYAAVTKLLCALL
jgi:hypothetical protein